MAKRKDIIPAQDPPAGYAALLTDIKSRIALAQVRAVLSVNAELVRLYWDIGRLIDGRQQSEGWGTRVIPRLARALHNELPEEKGFSERNIGRMIAFFRAYPNPSEFLPQPVAKLAPSSKLPQAVAKTEAPGDSILWSIPWGHHALLLEKIDRPADRLWYMAQTLANGWSRNVLMLMVKSNAHARAGKALTNFHRHLPDPQSDLIRQALKDPYVFDFLTLQEAFHERELETNLLRQLERFLLELGQGFAFVGRQVPLKVGDQEFFIDLLFYHLRLRRFIVIDLKTGAFKPEYAGKMDFYLAVVDDKFRHPDDSTSIGLILCQDRNQIIAEYALRDAGKPIGIAEYQVTRALPADLRSSLPTVEQIEAELGETEDKPSRSASVKPTQSKRGRKK